MSVKTSDCFFWCWTAPKSFRYDALEWPVAFWKANCVSTNLLRQTLLAMTPSVLFPDPLTPTKTIEASCSKVRFCFVKVVGLGDRDTAESQPSISHQSWLVSFNIPRPVSKYSGPTLDRAESTLRCFEGRCERCATTEESGTPTWVC